MSATTTIPLEIQPQAAELVAEIGMQAEFEKMLDYLRNNVEGLTNLTVKWGDPCDTGVEPRIVIEGEVDRSFDSVYQTETDLHNWMIAIFPPEVWWRFPMYLSSLR